MMKRELTKECKMCSGNGRIRHDCNENKWEEECEECYGKGIIITDFGWELKKFIDDFIIPDLIERLDDRFYKEVRDK